MGLLNIIRRMHLRQKLSIREIARRTGLSRNTVSKHLAADTVEPKFATPERPSKLDPFAEKVAGWLKTNAGKPRKERQTLKKMHADLVTLGSLREGIEDEFLTPFKVRQMADGKDRSIQYIAATTYWGPDGKPMTAQQFLERLYGDLSNLIMDEDALRKAWSAPESREHFLSVLEQRGYDPEKLGEMRRLSDAPDSDLFDVLAYIRFSTPPKTRSARAASANDDLDSQHEQMKAFLRAVLQAYAAKGESELASRTLSDHLETRFGTLADAKQKLGDIATIRQAFIDIQRVLYRQ